MSASERTAPNGAPFVLGAAGIFMLVIALMMVLGMNLFQPAAEAQVITVTESPEAPSPSASPSATTDPAEEYVIALPERKSNRLNSDGMSDEAREDSEVWRAELAEQAKHDPLTLYLYYMDSPLGQKDPLENEAALAKDGRIENGNVYSERGIKAYQDWLFLWELTDITLEDEITFQASNTGVDGTTVTQSDGVRGDDKSGVDITYYDATGKVAAEHSALNRCTQPTGGKTTHPEGPTDNPEKPKPKPPEKPDKPKPKPPEKPAPKDPAKDPYPRGNAPTGGGKNADPGPGEYKAPEEMEQPPAKKYTPPPAPKPTPPPSGTGSGREPTDPDPAPTKDSAPPPKPEPEAPTPEEPETGCIAIPGVEDCS